MTDKTERSAHRPVERLDISELARMVREHRGTRSLRSAAQDAKVSFSTLSRIEAGAQPDLTAFTSICAWLGVPPGRFFTATATREERGVDTAIAHLNADPRLTPEAREQISRVLTDIYGALARETQEEPVALVACHLRAAPMLRPGVPERLTSLLTDMHAALEERVKEGTL